MKKSLAAATRTAAAHLLVASQGNDVSVASFKASPAKLAALDARPVARAAFLEKTGMGISAKVPTDLAQGQKKVTRFHGDLARAIFEFAQVPSAWPETAQSRADRARAQADAAVLAAALQKTGGQLYVVNWNNRDDTVVNIIAALNKNSGELSFVKLFPAI